MFISLLLNFVMKPFANHTLNLIKYFSHSPVSENPSFDVIGLVA
jgi:hypothetical protein